MERTFTFFLVKLVNWNPELFRGSMENDDAEEKPNQNKTKKPKNKLQTIYLSSRGCPLTNYETIKVHKSLSGDSFQDLYT